MDRVQAWRKAGGDQVGLKNRLDLFLGVDSWTNPSDAQLWGSKIIALASEGYGLRDFEQILTEGRREHNQLREKWDLGDGGDTKWGPAEKFKAKEVLWDFAKVRIQLLHQGASGSNGIGYKKVSEVILLETGFKLPHTTMAKQMQSWKGPIRGTGDSTTLVKPRSSKVAVPGLRLTPSRLPVSSNSTLERGLELQRDVDHDSPPQPKKQRLWYDNVSSQGSPRQTFLPSLQSPVLQRTSPSDMQSRLASLEKRMAAQNKKYERLSSESQSQARSFDEKITGEKTAREKAVKELELKIHGLQERNAKLETEISTLKEEIRGLQQTIKTLESENTQLTSEVVQLRGEKLSLQQLLDEKMVILERSHLLFDQLKTKIRTLSKNKGTEPLDQQIEILDRALSYVSIDETSREVRIDSGYHDDQESRKSINFVPLSFQSLVRLNADIDLSPKSSSSISAKRHGFVGRASSVNGASVGEPPRLSSEMDTHSSTSSENLAIEAMDDPFEIQSLHLNEMDTQIQSPNTNNMLAYWIAEHAPGSFEDLYDQIEATMRDSMDFANDETLYNDQGAGGMF